MPYRSHRVALERLVAGNEDGLIDGVARRVIPRRSADDEPVRAENLIQVVEQDFRWRGNRQGI